MIHILCPVLQQNRFLPLPYMPILGFSNSGANKNMVSKIWTNGIQLSDWVGNIVGKGEIALNEQFLLFPHCFLLKRIIVFPFVQISAIIFLFVAEVEEPKIGISGKGLMHLCNTIFQTSCHIIMDYSPLGLYKNLRFDRLQVNGTTSSIFLSMLIFYKNPSSQDKDTKVVPLAARLFKNEAPTAPFHWIPSKPIVCDQTIRKKKSSAKQKTIMAAPVKNKSCRVYDKILPKKSRRSIFNQFFIVHNQLREISGEVLLQAFWLVRNYISKGSTTCDIL